MNGSPRSVFLLFGVVGSLIVPEWGGGVGGGGVVVVVAAAVVVVVVGFCAVMLVDEVVVLLREMAGLFGGDSDGL